MLNDMGIYQENLKKDKADSMKQLDSKISLISERIKENIDEFKTQNVEDLLKKKDKIEADLKDLNKNRSKLNDLSSSVNHYIEKIENLDDYIIYQQRLPQVCEYIESYLQQMNDKLNYESATDRYCTTELIRPIDLSVLSRDKLRDLIISDKFFQEKLMRKGFPKVNSM